MSQEAIAILKEYLAENEKVRRRQLVAFAILFLAAISLLLWIGHLANQPTTDLRGMILWSVIFVLVAVVYGVISLAIYINLAITRLLKTLKGISEQT